MSMPISVDDPFYFISQRGALQAVYNEISGEFWGWVVVTVIFSNKVLFYRIL